MRRWLIVLIVLGGLLGLGAAFGPFGQPNTSLSVIVHGPARSITPKPAPSPPAGTHPIQPCIKYGATSDPFTNVPATQKLGPDAFGPPVSMDLGQLGVNDALVFRLCGGTFNGLTHGPDERLWASIYTAVNGGNPNAHVPNHTWVNGVNFLVSHIQWDKTRTVRVRFPDQSSPWTELMIPGYFPEIQATPGTTHDDWFLRVTFTTNTGHPSVLFLRLRCGFQPYWPSSAGLPVALRASA